MIVFVFCSIKSERHVRTISNAEMILDMVAECVCRGGGGGVIHCCSLRKRHKTEKIVVLRNCCVIHIICLFVHGSRIANGKYLFHHRLYSTNGSQFIYLNLA